MKSLKKDYFTIAYFYGLRTVSHKENDDLIEGACANVTKEEWTKEMKKARKIIKKDYDRDINIDNVIENQIIIYTSD